MQRIKRKLRASTLVETLVMMLVAGIVFLGVMDGLTLFTRVQTQQAEALLTAGRQREGYFRLESLTAGADSILPTYDGLGVYRGGRQSQLSLGDSGLVYHSGEFRDTLLHGVAGLDLTGEEPDTLKVALAEGFTIRLPLKPASAKEYRQALEAIENGYGYEE